MDKSSEAGAGVCGIDISAQTLAVAVQRAGASQWVLGEVANTAAGHQQLLAQLQGMGGRVRVVMEASGVYGLDLAVCLAGAPGIELAVLNPKTARRFAESLGERSKTDPVDARVLGEYAARMPFTPWQPPRTVVLELRAITRRIATLKVQHGQESNRLHAQESSEQLPACVRRELRSSLLRVERAVEKLTRAALALVAHDPPLAAALALLQSAPGVGETSALQILGEVSALPSQLGVKQWVAHCGLDARQHLSGSSVHRPARISKAGNRRLRRALFMPALVAVRHDPHLRAFYLQLLRRGKAKLQALVAVMRKLLHAFYGMLRLHQPYCGARLLPALTV